MLERDEEGVFEAARLFEELQERHPGRFSPGQLRTLQRRIRDWKAVRGPERQVIFPQVREKVPGELRKPQPRSPA